MDFQLRESFGTSSTSRFHYGLQAHGHGPFSTDTKKDLAVLWRGPSRMERGQGNATDVSTLFSSILRAAGLLQPFDGSNSVMKRKWFNLRNGSNWVKREFVANLSNCWSKFSNGSPSKQTFIPQDLPIEIGLRTLSSRATEHSTKIEKFSIYRTQIAVKSITKLVQSRFAHIPEPQNIENISSR